MTKLFLLIAEAAITLGHVIRESKDVCSTGLEDRSMYDIKVRREKAQGDVRPLSQCFDDTH